ncbi:hypothetical protein DdX_07348 [Ditylenchus destructor]|uniref:Uncharacterized protein n=1 Tax=Ditylenchus destructor TaxID=166010 RepID=A0AAD4N9D6_9BILA|nr:hypothetical protein DdX_07348 [Ditylenchus destructor]
MGCEYLKTIHGVMSLLQIVLGFGSLMAGYFLWNKGDVFFLFWMGEMKLLTLILVILTTVWIISLGIAINQVFGRDVLEKLGKLKVVSLHLLCALVTLLSAIIETIYYASSDKLTTNSVYYVSRLTFVMDCTGVMDFENASTKVNSPSVRFFNLKYCYLVTESIITEIHYPEDFVVAERDWVGVLPAGFLRVGHFSALTMAPRRKPPKSVVRQGTLPRLGSCDTICGELHTIVFKAKDTKLAPRHFYQLAYIRNYRNQHRIIATSCIFYVEPGLTQSLDRHLIHTEDVMKQQVMVEQKPQESGGTCRLLKNLLCVDASSHYESSEWTTTSFVLPAAQSVGIKEEDSGVEEDLSPPQILNRSPFDAALDDADSYTSKQTQNDSSFGSAITQFLADWLRKPIGYDYKSASMYEIGSTPIGYMGALSEEHHQHDINTSPHDHYQKMICQLTMSNSNLMRDNENLKSRLRESEALLRDHMEHLNSVYYTLFRNGYSALQFPDGEEVHLSQFRGVLLNFIPSRNTANNNPGLQRINGFEETLPSQHKDRRSAEVHSDLSSDSSVSSASVDSEEVKSAMNLLKCITRPKYNDLDEFVNWLHEDTNIPHREGTSSSQQIKSRSLEDQHQFRKNRVALRRASRIDEINNVPNGFSNTARALSESELRPDRGSLQMETLSPNPPNNTGGISPNGGSVSARCIKNKTARLRAQSVGGSKILGGGGFLASAANSSRRTSGHGAKMDPGSTSRKSLVSMRSPILTLGRSSGAQKTGRNLI